MFYVLTFNEFRKNKIKELFEKLGIVIYRFIDAIDPYSPYVKKLIDKYNISNQWGCVICGRAKCNHVINNFTRFHISNFFGFVMMIQTFYDTKEEFGIMCEDDMVSLPWTKKGLNYVFENIKTINDPLIIRLGLGNRYKCFEEKEFKLEEKIKIGNVCFLINRKFAKLYLLKISKIKSIWQTDVFIHKRCFFKNIKSYSLNPCIFKDFSSQNSLIRRNPNPLDFYGIKIKNYWDMLIFTDNQDKIDEEKRIIYTSKYHPKYDLREFYLGSLEKYTKEEIECIKFFNNNIFKIKNIL